MGCSVRWGLRATSRLCCGPLAATSEDSILAFHHQLMTAVDALDTLGHASQEVFDLDSPLPGRSSAPAEVFLLARVAVVAAGRDVYSAAFARVTGHSWASHPARALPGREATVDLARGEASSNPAVRV